MNDLNFGWIIAAFAAGALCGCTIMWLISRDLMNTFKALASDSLSQNNEAFLHLAETRLKQSEQAASAVLSQKTTAVDEMVKPIKESLQRMDVQLQAIEVERKGAYSEISEMVKASRETQQQLRNETGQLLQALRAPTGRGRWGELQLQRILEMTGMSVHANDFCVQQTISGEDHNIRPDVIVNLPGERCIVIDSKVPLMAYLDAAQNSDEAAYKISLKQHAKQVRDHIRTLGNKAYWESMEGTPEFVVLFLPGEHFLSAALDNDPDIMEYSINQKVVLATPMTLIALLRTVAYGWRQEALNENVRKIADIGGKLYGSLTVFANQMEQLGNKLGGAVETYNKTIFALERKVFNHAKQLSEFGAASSENELTSLSPIERQPRSISIATDETKNQEDAA
ncbi:MAG: DNA recombination protein RmuC [Alphaproteobacteria bacterium]|nr:DNA recombination protein RmuC [Alphaproteobacteria bacterium]